MKIFKAGKPGAALIFLGADWLIPPKRKKITQTADIRFCGIAKMVSTVSVNPY